MMRSRLTALPISVLLTLMSPVARAADGERSPPGCGRCWEDTGRDRVFIHADGGVAMLRLYDGSLLPDAASLTPTGVAASAGLAVRIHTFGVPTYQLGPELEAAAKGDVARAFRPPYLTLGLRWGASYFPDFSVDAVMVGPGFHVPFWRMEASVGVDLGYAWVDTDIAVIEAAGPVIDGYLGDVRLGLDVLLGRHISVGLGARGGAMRLSREALSEPSLATHGVSWGRRWTVNLGFQLRI
ncbi:hypothetical protein [Sorangium sp. So ce1335]|uniref:hypothetical protein n=1 Tax=Sorangium sp. So ce1335 TaxID=3133335 RepID=UPI003F6151D2